MASPANNQSGKQTKKKTSYTLKLTGEQMDKLSNFLVYSPHVYRYLQDISHVPDDIFLYFYYSIKKSRLARVRSMNAYV